MNKHLNTVTPTKPPTLATMLAEAMADPRGRPAGKILISFCASIGVGLQPDPTLPC